MPQTRHFHLEFATTMCLAPKMVVWWGVRKESKARCCDTLSPTGQGRVLFGPWYSHGRPWPQRSGPACRPSRPAAACNSLLPSSFFREHVSNSSTEFRIGAMGQFASGESGDRWECDAGSKRTGCEPGAPSGQVTLTQAYRSEGLWKWVTSRTQ